MIEIKGTYSNAIIYADELDSSSEGQIKALCEQPFTEGANIRMMPDVHAGAGCVIGTTMTIGKYLCPNLVGVDIGCGMHVVQLNCDNIDFNKLDKVIRQNIPCGTSIRATQHRFTPDWIDTVFDEHVMKDRAKLSIGTLGGGNHFIEIDRDDEDGTLYLVIHSGSRHLGLEIATW